MKEMTYHVMAVRGSRKYLVGNYADKSYAVSQARRYKALNPGYRVMIYTSRTDVQVIRQRVFC